MALRRVATVVLTALAAAAVIAAPVHAATVTQTIDGITYQVDDANVAAGATITGSGVVPANLVIPSTVDIGGVTYNVTQIGADAFDSKGLTSVTIPNTVEYIQPEAFAYNNLASVTIPGSVGLINTAAFRGNGMTSVTFSEGLEMIWGGAFYDNNLTSVVIPTSVYNITGQAFGLNPGLTSVTFLGNAPTLSNAGPIGTSSPTVYFYEDATGFTTPTWTGGSSTTYTTEMIPLATVTFDANGHGTAPGASTGRPGTTVADPGALAATGFTFTGWWTAATGGTQVTFPYTRTSDVTLYAQWEAVPATISAPSAADAGAAITVTGSGFAPGEALEIWVLSTPVRVATLTADAGGAFSTTVTIPANVPAGTHTIEVRGTSTATVSSAITIRAVLAATGPASANVGWLALALIAAGTGLIAARRRVGARS